MVGVGNDAEITTGQKVQKAQLFNTCSTPLEAQVGQNGEEWHRSGCLAMLLIVSQAIGAVQLSVEPGFP